MNRSEILAKLQAHKPILAECFGVTWLALFGSYARDQAAESAVKVLIGSAAWRLGAFR